MRKTIAILSLLFAAWTTQAQINDPVIMTINGKPVYKAEFEYIYNKNNNSTAIEPKSLNEYIDLFVKFKLKVTEAEAKGIDKKSEFKTELAGYRKQLAQPYLIDQEADEKIIKESYKRISEMVKASHILIRFKNETDPNDTLAAYTKISDIRQRAVKGEDFAKLAILFSEDESAQKNSGNLGFFRGFMMVRPFEDAAYNTPVGSISMPIRTPFGYHIIKVDDRQPDPGQVLVAHIMINLPQGSNDKLATEAKKQIDNIADQLKKGASFETLATQHSQDQFSASNGGALQWFSKFAFPIEFDEASFNLKKVGDISSPVRTAFGWHIIKLLDKRPMESFEEKREEITSQLGRIGLDKEGKKSFISQLKKEYQPQFNNEARQQVLAMMKGASTDSIFYQEASTINTTLLTIKEKNYSIKDFALFVQIASNFNQEKQKGNEQSILIDYESLRLEQYEEARLDQKYPEFKNLMQEYHDGMLFFEISNEEVWEKASKDTKGLTKFFKKNKKKYAYNEPHFKGYLLNCATDSVLNVANDIIKNAPKDSALLFVNRKLNDTTSLIKISKAIYTAEEKTAALTEGAKNTKLPIVSFYQTKELTKLPEEYQDVKGLVITDYQNQLEDKWIKALRKKYKVVLMPEVIKAIKQ